jgi:DNA uptake protein ComE-like DNA-binding protein
MRTVVRCQLSVVSWKTKNEERETREERAMKNLNTALAEELEYTRGVLAQYEKEQLLGAGC